MGSYYGWGFKTELDALLWIDAVTLKQLGYLKAGTHSGTMRWTNTATDRKSSVGLITKIDEGVCKMTLNYTTIDRFSGEKKALNYEVMLTRTACNFGGCRFWIHCPLSKNGIKCGRRARKLYCYQDYFGCRDCLALCYSTQNENPAYRKGIYRLLTIGYKIDELEASIKRRTYAGRPTKKMRKLYKLSASLPVEYDMVKLERSLLQ